MDHSIAVLELVSVEEVLIGFFVALLDKVRNAVQVNCAEVNHCVGVTHFCGLEITTNCELPVLFDSISAEVAISDFVFCRSIVALRRFYEVRYSFLGAFFHSKTMLVEDTKIEERFSSFSLDDFRRNSGDILLIDRQFPHYAFQPMDGKMVMVLVFFLHDRCLVHQFIGKLDLAFVVSLNTAFVEHLQGQLGVLLADQSFGIDHSQVVIGLTESLLLRLCQQSDDCPVDFIVVGHFGAIVFLTELIVKQKNCQVVGSTGEVHSFGSRIEIFRLFLILLDSEKLPRVILEVSELINFTKFGHSLRRFIGNLSEHFEGLLDIFFVLAISAELSINQAQSISVISVWLLAADGFLVVHHRFLEIHGQKSPFLVYFTEESAGLRIAVAIGFFMVNVQSFDDVFFLVNAVNELIGVMQPIRFCSSVPYNFFYDLPDHWLLDLPYLLLRPLPLQNIANKAIISLIELGTNEGLNTILGFKQGKHLPLRGCDFEVVHRRLELLSSIGSATKKLGILYRRQVLTNSDQAGVSVIDDLLDLRVDLEIE